MKLKWKHMHGWQSHCGRFEIKDWYEIHCPSTPKWRVLHDMQTGRQERCLSVKSAKEHAQWIVDRELDEERIA